MRKEWKVAWVIVGISFLFLIIYIISKIVTTVTVVESITLKAPVNTLERSVEICANKEAIKHYSHIIYEVSVVTIKDVEYKYKYRPYNQIKAENKNKCTTLNLYDNYNKDDVRKKLLKDNINYIKCDVYYEHYSASPNYLGGDTAYFNELK